MKVAVYCRVSTDSKDQANSFENQKSYFEREITKNQDYELINIYADRGISGTKLQRPEFDKMLYDAGLDIQKVPNADNDQRKEYIKYYTTQSSSRQPIFNLIITKNTSRFARNTNITDILDDLKKNKVYVHFLDLNKTTQNDSDITVIKLFQVFDENDSRDKSVKVRFGMEEGARHGIVHTNSKLYGYKYIQQENRLEIIPEEAKIIKLIYTLYSSGLGSRQIINTLTDSGVKTRQEKTFCKSTIRRILDNEKYAGLNNALKYDTGIVFAKNSYPKVKDTYNVIKSDKIPSIIDIELFYKCKDILMNKINYNNQKGIYKGTSKYSELIYCGKCGSVYHRNSDNGRVFYNCSNKKLHGISICDNPNINENFIDEYFSDLAKGKMYSSINTTKEISIRRIYKEIMAQYQRINTNNSDEVKSILIQIQKQKDKLNRYIEIFSMGQSSQDIVRDKIKETENTISYLQKQYNSLSEDNVTIINKILNLYNIAQKISKFQNKKTYTIQEITNMISKITIYKNGDHLDFTTHIKPLDNVYNLVDNLDSVWEDEYFDENEIKNIIQKIRDNVS